MDMVLCTQSCLALCARSGMQQYGIGRVTYILLWHTQSYKLQTEQQPSEGDPTKTRAQYSKYNRWW